MAANSEPTMIFMVNHKCMKFSLIQASLQWLHAIKMYTVVLQRTSNLPTKVPIIKKQWAQAETLRAKLMIKDKETANSHG